MRPEQIKADLEGRGLSLAALSRETGIPQPNFSRAISRNGKSRKAEAVIAQALDKPLHIVFPDRYQPPEGYVPPATIEISVKELAQIKTSLAQATRALELLGA